MMRHTEDVSLRESASRIQNQGDSYAQSNDFDHAIQQYELAINTLTQLGSFLNANDFRQLSDNWYKMGEIYKQCGYRCRKNTIECFNNALNWVHKINAKQNEHYNHIVNIYQSLASLHTYSSDENNLYSLGSHIFNNAMYEIPQSFENNLYDLDNKPASAISKEMYDAWIQLLELIIDAWKPEFFAEASAMRKYLSQPENVEMIKEHIDKLKAKRFALTTIISRSAELNLDILMTMLVMKESVESLKRQVTQLQMQVKELKEKQPGRFSLFSATNTQPSKVDDAQPDEPANYPYG